MPRGWPETLWPPPILNLTMKDHLNPSSKSLHRTDRPPTSSLPRRLWQSARKGTSQVSNKGDSLFLKYKENRETRSKNSRERKVSRGLKEYSHQDDAWCCILYG